MAADALSPQPAGLVLDGVAFGACRLASVVAVIRLRERSPAQTGPRSPRWPHSPGMLPIGMYAALSRAGGAVSFAASALFHLLFTVPVLGKAWQRAVDGLPGRCG
jgi:hypothetical protein